jgi:hypothetical protein
MKSVNTSYAKLIVWPFMNDDLRPGEALIVLSAQHLGLRRQWRSNTAAVRYGLHRTPIAWDIGPKREHRYSGRCR